MAWTDIPDENLSPNAPARSADMIAMRDNFAALANGDAGAPKVQTAAIEDGAVTTPKLADNSVTTEKIASGVVAAEMAQSGVGAVGTYAMLSRAGSGFTPGAVYSGLSYSNGSNSLGTSAPGSWRAMGGTSSSSSESTIFLRVS